MVVSLGVIALCIIAASLVAVLRPDAPSNVAAPEDGVPTPAPSADSTPVGDELQAPSSAEAAALALETGARVEDVSQRTATTQVFANPDGDWLLRDWITTSFVEIPGADGEEATFQPVDLRLAAGDDGRLHPAVYEGDLSFSSGGAADAAVRWSLPDTEVTVEMSLAGGGALPQGVVDGGRVVYADALPGVDFVLDVRPAGFEQFFVIKTPDAASEAAGRLGLEIRVQGGDAVADESGVVTIRDAAGATVGTLPAALAWDAVDDGARATHVLGAWSLDGEGPAPTAPAGIATEGAQARWDSLIATGGVPEERTVATAAVPVGGGVALSLAVNSGWLSDPDTVYPVVIDPALYQTNSYYDTYIRTSSPSSNFGTATELMIGSTNGGGIVYRSLLAFDTTTMKTLDVTNGYLYLLNSWSATCTDYPWSAYWYSPPDGASTWYNQGSGRGSYTSESWETVGHTSGTRPYCSTGVVGMDISGFARSWVTRPENQQGLLLLANNEGALTHWKRFWSLDASNPNKPHIDYYYNRAPAVPTTLLVGGEPLTADLTTSARPTLSAVVTDPDGGQVRALFTVKVDGIAIVDSLPGTLVTSGQPSTVDLPYALQAGVHYTIEVRGSDSRLEGAVFAPAFWVTGPGDPPSDLDPSNDDETGVAP